MNCWEDGVIFQDVVAAFTVSALFLLPCDSFSQYLFYLDEEVDFEELSDDFPQVPLYDAAIDHIENLPFFSAEAAKETIELLKSGNLDEISNTDELSDIKECLIVLARKSPVRQVS